MSKKVSTFNSIASNVFSLAFSLLFIHICSASASPIVFRGQNAGIFPEANPNSTATLMNSVTKPAAKPTEVTPIDQNRLIIQGLNSQLTNKIYNDIFAKDTNGDPVNDDGNYNLPGGGSISFINDGTNITITIVDANGIVSEIVMPNI